MKDTNVNQNPTKKSRRLATKGYRGYQGLTWSSECVGTSVELCHLVFDICVKCDIDQECDESDDSSQKRDDRCNEGDGDVRAQGQ